MSAFRPRAVPPRQWRAWALEAFWLVTERWYWHVPLALGLAGLGTCLPRLFQVALGVAALALFALLAHAGTQRVPLRQVLAQHAGALTRLVLGWTVALLLAVASLLPFAPRESTGLPGEAARATATQAALTPAQAVRQAGADLLVTAGLLLAGPGALFFLALRLFVPAPLLLAIDLTADAVARNRFVIPAGLALGALLSAAGWFEGLWVAGALPWAGAVVLVAFRDVFLHEAPTPRTSATRPVAASASASAP